MDNNLEAREYFAKGLKELRQKRNYTQQDLADVMKVSHNTISSWETARTEPSMQDICKLMVLFKTEFSDFIVKGMQVREDEHND